VSQPLHSSSAH